MSTPNALDLGAILAGNFLAAKQVDLKTLRWQSPLAGKDGDSMYTDWRFVVGAGATAVNLMGWGGAMAERASFDLASAALGSLTTTETIRAEIMKGVDVPAGKKPTITETVNVSGEPQRAGFFR
jgi:hypothetical protein